MSGALLGYAATMGAPRVSIADGSVDDITLSPTNASAAYQLTNAGGIEGITVSGGTDDRGPWITPITAAGSNYEVRATVTSGSVSTGTTGSWLSLGTTRSWTREQTTVGSSSCTLTIEIRHAVTLVVLDTAEIILTAEKAT